MNRYEKHCYRIAVAALGSRKLRGCIPPHTTVVDARVCDECNGAGLRKAVVTKSYLAQYLGIDYCVNCKGSGVVLDQQLIPANDYGKQ